MSKFENDFMRTILMIFICLYLPLNSSSQPVRIESKVTKFGKFGFIPEDGKDLAEPFGGGMGIFGIFNPNWNNYDTSLLKTGIITSDSFFLMRNGKISDNKIISLASVIKEFYFVNCKIESCFFEAEDIHYKLYFKDCIIKNYVSFMDANIYEPISFDYSKFEGGDFRRTKFVKEASFLGVQFEKNVDFSDAEFKDGVEFWRTNFKSSTDFSNTLFHKKINLMEANFAEPVDFRLANLDTVGIFLLDEIKFKPGSLYCYWNQFEAKDSFKITLGVYNYSDKKKDFVRLEKVYEAFKNNFDEQKKSDESDEVMYELARQRDTSLGEINQKLYGFFFGYGYKPWRFLLFVFLPVIVIFSIIYFHYYNIIYLVLYGQDNNDENKKAATYGDVSLLSKLIHLFYFSSWVLFSLRISKEWITKRNNAFNVIVLVEYFLGIFLFISFAILITSSRFDFIKSITGFS